MIRPLVTLALGWILTTLVLHLSSLPGTPGWTAWVGGSGAGFLALGVVLMEDGVPQDAAKAVVLTLVGGFLLVQGTPGWMAWPMILGPWVGFFGARRGRY